MPGAGALSEVTPTLLKAAASVGYGTVLVIVCSPPTCPAPADPARYLAVAVIAVTVVPGAAFFGPLSETTA